MLTDPIEKSIASQVAGFVHSGKKLEAANFIDESLKLNLRLDDDPKKYLPVLLHYVHHLLNTGGPAEAAQILWTPSQFSPHPKYTQDVWKLFDRTSQGLIMGAASCSKSYGMGVRFFLEWLRDPEWTDIRLLGPSEAHLEQNLFSHLVRLHKTATLPMPGEIGELFIGLDRRNQLSSIKGVIIPIGQKKKAGRLQGAKQIGRTIPHHVFGTRSRLFIFIDEIENVPGGLWSDVDNIFSNIQEEGDPSGFKIIGAYNPTNQGDEVAKRAESLLGWEVFDIENDYQWKSKRGWDVLRLDGERSENVVQGKIVFPGLQTKHGLEVIARNAGGKQAAGYFSMGRGAYPPQGIELTVIPPGMLAKWRGKFIWYDEPRPVGSEDLALEGGAAAIYTLGKWGRATGILFPPSLDFPSGRKFMFKDRNGHSVSRWALQADQQFIVPKGDTVAMTNRTIDINKKAGVRGEYFACDRTGAGAGTADLIKHDWSPSIHDVNYSEACSRDKIMLEDTKTCDEQFMRMNSELWFVMKSWGEFQYFLINPELDMTKLNGQLTQRKFRTVGGKTSVEPKKDYMSRGFESPDEADSLTLLVHAARKGSGVTLSMSLDNQGEIGGGDDMDGWYDEMTLVGGSRIDESNRTSFLDDGNRPMREEAIL